MIQCYLLWLHHCIQWKLWCIVQHYIQFFTKDQLSNDSLESVTGHDTLYTFISGYRLSSWLALWQSVGITWVIRLNDIDACPQYEGHPLMLTWPTTLDSASNATSLPLTFTFRMQPTNGEDTSALWCSVIPEWRGKDTLASGMCYFTKDHVLRKISSERFDSLTSNVKWIKYCWDWGRHGGTCFLVGHGVDS